MQKGVEYAILTDEISRAWSGMSTRQYKNLKGLKKENLRDNMTTLELVLNMLAEATTTQFQEIANQRPSKRIWQLPRRAVRWLDEPEKTLSPSQTRRSLLLRMPAQLNQVVTDLLEGAVSDTTEESKDK